MYHFTSLSSCFIVCYLRFQKGWLDLHFLLRVFPFFITLVCEWMEHFFRTTHGKYSIIQWLHRWIITTCIAMVLKSFIILNHLFFLLNMCWCSSSSSCSLQGRIVCKIPSSEAIALLVLLSPASTLTWLPPILFLLQM